MRRTRSCARGFNMAELLMAMTLFVIGFLGVLALFTTGFGAVTKSKNLTYACNIAQSQIEKIRFSDFSNIASSPRTTLYGSARVNGQNVTTAFYRTMTVTSNADNTLKNVVVQVTWEERGFSGTDTSEWKSISMETVITE